MSDAYLILCHHLPWQVNALARYVSSGGHRVFVHVDAQSRIAPEIEQGDAVRVLPRPAMVQWGGWGMVEATLKLMAAAVDSGQKFRYVHLLSGQCLPCMPLSRLDATLDIYAREARQLIECTPLPLPRWGRDGGLSRVETWYPRCMVSKYDASHRYFWWYTNKWIRLRLRRPGYYLFRPFYGGAQWWSLTGDCVERVMQFSKDHPFFRYFFHHTFCSDELYIQTCLARTGYLSSCSGDNMRFLLWQRPNDQSPRDLLPDDWPSAFSSGKLFARKFTLSPRQCAAYFAALGS